MEIVVHETETGLWLELKLDNGELEAVWNREFTEPLPEGFNSIRQIALRRNVVEILKESLGMMEG